MGMYCCCGVKISGKNYSGKPQCNCDWGSWISTCDWPPERKNRDNPISLPPIDGEYLTRTQTSCGDRYEDKKTFTLIPRIEKGGYIAPLQDCELHWEDETWEDGTPYAWKNIG